MYVVVVGVEGVIVDDVGVGGASCMRVGRWKVCVGAVVEMGVKVVW